MKSFEDFSLETYRNLNPATEYANATSFDLQNCLLNKWQAGHGPEEK